MATGRIAGIRTAAWLLGAIALSAGCGEGDGGAGPSPLAVAPAPEPDGDNQFANVGNTLQDALRVVVTRDGVPVEGVQVQWVTTSGGVLTPGTSTTAGDGVASTQWRLGPQPGQQSVNARVVEAEGSPVVFTAFATDPTPGGGGPPELAGGAAVR